MGQKDDFFYLPLADEGAVLAVVGGKGQSLARLTRMGLPVPDGFHLTVEGYKRFIRENRLQDQILQIVQEKQNVEQASTEIRALFKTGAIPTSLADAIYGSYTLLGESPPAVAVRSSATAEDLPDMSFAGQQETYLNVRGAEALQDAVRDCWASLWTARAIAYRERMGIDHSVVAMGVVVQVMVEAEVAGILFTANPTTGNRKEIVINASYGLGEAIVGGHVTPDSYVVDRESGVVKEAVIGTKAKRMVSKVGQGMKVEKVPAAEREVGTLAPKDIETLVTMCERVEQHFGGVPQDIEWGLAGGKMWLLQSRPITNLPPALLTEIKWEPDKPGNKFIRRQVVENMPDPLSPLFDELYLRQGMDHSMNSFLQDFGMDFDISSFVELPFFVTIHGFAYSRANYKFTWSVIPRILPAYFKMLPSLLRHGIERWRDEKLPAYLNVVKEWEAIDLDKATDAQLWAGMTALSNADARYWFEVSIIIGMAKVTDNFLHSFVTKLRGKKLTSGHFLRGYLSKTFEGQVDLEAIAKEVRADAVLKQLVLETPADKLWEVLKKEARAEGVIAGMEAYIYKYGHQIYTLDFAEPTQGEDRLPILLGLKALVKNLTDSTARQAELAQERDALAKTTAQALGALKRWRFRKLLSWAQKYAPHREDALFYIGAGWPVLRRLALELGRRLALDGALAEADDVFFLTIDEVTAAIKARAEEKPVADHKQVTIERRALREVRRLVHPPGKIPDEPYKIGPIDMSMFETQKVNANEGDELRGFAVSPGVVRGRVSLILSPADFEKMRPNTILVCPTTTPAWTPLFSQAIGLVTDIGGILAHGSIVAREYGIPAVLGLGNATQRIKDGQVIEVDGNAGIVRLVEEEV